MKNRKYEQPFNASMVTCNYCGGHPVRPKTNYDSKVL